MAVQINNFDSIPGIPNLAVIAIVLMHLSQ